MAEIGRSNQGGTFFVLFYFDFYLLENRVLVDWGWGVDKSLLALGAKSWKIHTEHPLVASWTNRVCSRG